jgi:hypothetical protein
MGLRPGERQTIPLFEGPPTSPGSMMNLAKSGANERSSRTTSSLDLDRTASPLMGAREKGGVHKAVALADERWICVGRYLGTAVFTESDDPRTTKPGVGCWTRP